VLSAFKLNKESILKDCVSVCSREHIVGLYLPPASTITLLALVKD
jgi:hypothetical protein